MWVVHCGCPMWLNSAWRRHSRTADCTTERRAPFWSCKDLKSLRRAERRNDDKIMLSQLWNSLATLSHSTDTYSLRSKRWCSWKYPNAWSTSWTKTRLLRHSEPKATNCGPAVTRPTEEEKQFLHLWSREWNRRVKNVQNYPLLPAQINWIYSSSLGLFGRKVTQDAVWMSLRASLNKSTRSKANSWNCIFKNCTRTFTTAPHMTRYLAE